MKLINKAYILIIFLFMIVGCKNTYTLTDRFVMVGIQEELTTSKNRAKRINKRFYKGGYAEPEQYVKGDSTVFIIDQGYYNYKRPFLSLFNKNVLPELAK